MNTVITLKVDSKGRISLPLSMRKSLNIKSGDVFFINEETTGLHLVKAENPFDVVIEDAIEQYRDGKTINLRKFAKNNRIKLDE